MKRTGALLTIIGALALPTVAQAQIRHHPLRCKTGYVKRHVQRRHGRIVVRCAAKHQTTPTAKPPVVAPAPAPSAPPVTSTTATTIIALVNRSSDVSDTALPQIAQALQTQVNRDLAPAYANVSATGLDFTPTPVPPVIVLPVGSDQTPPAGAWTLTIMYVTDTQQMGYHSIRTDGTPYAEVSTETGVSPTRPWTMTASHELLEMLTDPRNNEQAIGPNGIGYAYEVADPVEATSYTIDGIVVSDFVAPNWFVTGASAPWDYASATPGPLQCATGGYVGTNRS